MNSINIIKILKTDKFTKKHFIGVFARDELPSKFILPSCYIINTHNRDQPGEHWLAFFINKNGNVEFFDPIGLNPKFYRLNDYLENISKQKKIFSKKRVQGYLSNYCGIYCIYFLFRRCRGDSFNKIIKSFGSYNENDKYIKSKLK